jgi:formylglycine-generating enzyme required for sulfatase activity
LSLTGYRLPTEAEWEFACRAGAETSRYYGESTKLLAKFGWFDGNSLGRSWPVGSLKPNDLGLFDMHGNVWNWCQERYLKYLETRPEDTVEDKEDDVLIIDSEKSRVLRGGAFLVHPSLVRSAFRYNSPPVVVTLPIGVRPARTFR